MLFIISQKNVLSNFNDIYFMFMVYALNFIYLSLGQPHTGHLSGAS